MWQHTCIFLIFYASICVAEYTPEDCKELGYIKAELMCSTCEQFDSFGLEILTPHCMECCLADKVANTPERRYPKATLEVCTCKFRAYPQIEAFIKKLRPEKFPNLQIKYVRGLDPIIKLQDKAGNVKETHSITKWNTDTVQEFFETHLEKTDEQTSGNKIIDEKKDDFLKTNLI